MDQVTDILLDALSISKKVGPFMFNGVLLAVALAFYLPTIRHILPLNILYGWLLINIIGQIIMQTRYAKHPTITNRECPICQTRLAYSALKCPNNGCDFSIDIPTDIMSP